MLRQTVLPFFQDLHAEPNQRSSTFVSLCAVVTKLPTDVWQMISSPCRLACPAVGDPIAHQLHICHLVPCFRIGSKKSSVRSTIVAMMMLRKVRFRACQIFSSVQRETQRSWIGYKQKTETTTSSNSSVDYNAYAPRNDLLVAMLRVEGVGVGPSRSMCSTWTP